jgi:hypothetical protein
VAIGHTVYGYSTIFVVKNISFLKDFLNDSLLNLKKDTSLLQFLPNVSIHTLVFNILILFCKSWASTWRFGYLGIPLASNVASWEILLDTAIQY